MMATVGRGRAVAIVGGGTFDGFVAWVMWAVVHIWSLIEFRSRLAVMLQWAWAYVSRQRTSRLITGEPNDRAGELLPGRAPQGDVPFPDGGTPADESPKRRIATVVSGRSDSHA